MWLYAFWHSPRPDAAPERYEVALAAFHRALGQAARAAGMPLRSEAAAVGVPPWRPAEAAATVTYEDDYWVERFADLERLERMAVEGAMGAPHQEAATLARLGQAGLYRCLGAGLPVPAQTFATWLDKPDGEGYAGFEARLERAAQAAGGVVMRRTMTLSPAPEYLVRSAALASLGDRHGGAHTARRRPVWPPLSL